jgi:hypothetical protein
MRHRDLSGFNCACKQALRRHIGGEKMAQKLTKEEQALIESFVQLVKTLTSTGFGIFVMYIVYKIWNILNGG